MGAQEGLLLIVHFAGEAGEPTHNLGPGQRLASGRRRQFGPKGDADRPVQPSLQVARVLDVPEQLPGPRLQRELVASHPGDGGRQHFAEADGAARDVPKALAGASFASGEQDTGLGGNDDFDREARYPGIDRFVLALGQRAMGRAKGISARPADQTNITSQAPMHVRAYDGRTARTIASMASTWPSSVATHLSQS